MIRTILALGLIAGLTNEANAQHFSVGARTGVGTLIEVRKGTKDVQNITWDKEIFLRYETKRRLAFETGITHYKYDYPIDLRDGLEYANLDFAPSPYEFIEGSGTVNAYAINLSAQYDISCPFLKDHCPVFKNLRSYIGINLMPTISSGSQSITSRRKSDGTIFTEESTSPASIDFQAGVSHTLVYTINKFYLTTVVGINYTEFSSYPFIGGPNFKGYARIGVGYNLF